MENKNRISFTLTDLEFAGLCGIASARRTRVNEAAKMIVQARLKDGRDAAEAERREHNAANQLRHFGAGR